MENTLGSRGRDRIIMWSLPSASCVTRIKSLVFIEPQVPHLSMKPFELKIYFEAWKKEVTLLLNSLLLCKNG